MSKNARLSALILSIGTILGLALYVFSCGIEPAFAGQRIRETGIAFTALGTGNSGVFSPRRGHTKIAAYVIATRVGTVKVQRCSRANDALAVSSCTWRDISSGVTNVANTEDVLVIDFPVPSPVRVTYTNTDNNAGTYAVEFIEGGERE